MPFRSEEGRDVLAPAPRLSMSAPLSSSPSLASSFSFALAVCSSNLWANAVNSGLRYLRVCGWQHRMKDQDCKPQLKLEQLHILGEFLSEVLI